MRHKSYKHRRHKSVTNQSIIVCTAQNTKEVKPLNATLHEPTRWAVMSARPNGLSGRPV